MEIFIGNRIFESESLENLTNPNLKIQDGGLRASAVKAVKQFISTSVSFIIKSDIDSVMSNLSLHMVVQHKMLCNALITDH